MKEQFPLDKVSPYMLSLERKSTRGIIEDERNL